MMNKLEYMYTGKFFFCRKKGGKMEFLISIRSDITFFMKCMLIEINRATDVLCIEI